MCAPGDQRKSNHNQHREAYLIDLPLPAESHAQLDVRISSILRNHDAQRPHPCAARRHRDAGRGDGDVERAGLRAQRAEME